MKEVDGKYEVKVVIPERLMRGLEIVELYQERTLSECAEKALELARFELELGMPLKPVVKRPKVEDGESTIEESVSFSAASKEVLETFAREVAMTEEELVTFFVWNRLECAPEWFELARDELEEKIWGV